MDTIIKNILQESTALIIILLGFVLYLVLIILFVWNQNFEIHEQIDSEFISHFSNVVNGLVGSLWTLSSILLFYVALKNQQTTASEIKYQSKIMVHLLECHTLSNLASVSAELAKLEEPGNIQEELKSDAKKHHYNLGNKMYNNELQ